MKTKYNYKRVNLKSPNWLEIRTPIKGGGVYGNDWILRDSIRRSFTGQLNATRHAEIIDWATKVTQSGYRYNLPGGDNQVVVQLKKI